MGPRASGRPAVHPLPWQYEAIFDGTPAPGPAAEPPERLRGGLDRALAQRRADHPLAYAHGDRRLSGEYLVRGGTRASNDQSRPAGAAPWTDDARPDRSPRSH